MAYDAYIDNTFYNGTYKGAAIDASSFARIALRASEEIDTLTGQKIRDQGGIAVFSTEDQQRIKLATSAMAEWLAQQDETAGASGTTLSSEKVGSYSYTVDMAESDRARGKAYARAADMLFRTGLLYSGVETCGQ